MVRRAEHGLDSAKSTMNVHQRNMHSRPRRVHSSTWSHSAKPSPSDVLRTHPPTPYLPFVRVSKCSLCGFRPLMLAAECNRMSAYQPCLDVSQSIASGARALAPHFILHCMRWLLIQTAAPGLLSQRHPSIYQPKVQCLSRLSGVHCDAQ